MSATAASGASFRSIYPTDSVGGSSQFGSAVAVNYAGNVLIAGGDADNGDVGAAWIFSQSSVGSSWNQQGLKLIGTDLTGTPQQGFAVAISSDGCTVASGGPLDNFEAGAVWIFQRLGGSGVTWQQDGPKLAGTGSAGFTGSQQGWSVSLSADGYTLASGAPSDQPGAVYQYGSTFIWQRSTHVPGSSPWRVQGTPLVGSGGVQGTLAGYSVSLSANGDILAMGSRASDVTPGLGGVWIFSRSASAWTPLTANPILPSDYDDVSGVVEFGAAVSLSANGLFLGAGALEDNSGIGAAWVFSTPSQNQSSSNIDLNAQSFRQCLGGRWGPLDAL